MKKKNKRENQIQKKKKHKEEIREAKRKRRNQAPSLERPQPSRIEKEKILIVCEGENTEPSYFGKFKLSTATVKTVGEGRNTISLVDRTKQLSKKDEYDQIWCVFDKDDFTSEGFNNAIFKAKGLGFKVGYSNQAFEYWLILHFEDHQGGAMHRDQYCDKLNSYLEPFGVKYDKNTKEITIELFDILVSKEKGAERSRQELACLRARRNLAYFDGNNPAKEESSTRVHQLVQEIEKYR